MSKVDVLLGLQWGDEGKGKIVDVLTPEYDVIARFQGGPNAGHTIEFGGIMPKEPFKEGFRPLDDLPEFVDWFKRSREK